MKLISAVVATASLLTVGQATTAAEQDKCPVSDEQFLGQLSMMKDWATIYSVFKRNIPRCPDDGFYAEGYTDVVVVALAARWSELPKLERLLVRDAEFKRFVYRHINASADENDLHRVLHNAQRNCPPKQTHLCSEISTHVKNAIVDLK